MLDHNWSLYLFHSELKYNSRTDSLTANMFIKSQCFRLIDFFPRKQRISLYSSMQTHIHAHPYCLLSIIQSELNGLQAYKFFYLLRKHSHRSKMEQWLNWSIQQVRYTKLVYFPLKQVYKLLKNEKKISQQVNNMFMK